MYNLGENNILVEFKISCKNPCDIKVEIVTIIIVIEGFGGKRALGFLLKSELCQNCSKFRMQFCLGALNNVLHVFSLKLASFSKYYVCKKPVFVVTSACDRKKGNFTLNPAKY